MTKKMRGVLVAGAVAVGFLSVGDLSAQDLSWSFSGEAAGDKVYVLFAQPTVVFGTSPGLRPLVHVAAHWVDSDGNTTWGVTPAGGLRWQDSGGFIEGIVGWAIAGEENGFDPFAGGKNGLSTGVHVEYWGSGAWAAQGIANFNWGADFLWSRGRLLKRVATRSNGGPISLGAALTWEASADSDIPSGQRYQATFIGPVLQIGSPSGVNWALGGGYKHIQPASAARNNNTWYAQVELYLP